jgi:hypothetical protein
MNLEEFTDAMTWWLSRFPIRIMPEAFGKEIEPLHFRLGIIQVEPEPKKRVFEMMPLDCKDCWEVRELEAA